MWWNVGIADQRKALKQSRIKQLCTQPHPTSLSTVKEGLSPGQTGPTSLYSSASSLLFSLGQAASLN